MLGEIYKIGDWSVFPAENTLRRDGSEVKVPPRLMDALIFFARHPDHVISRTELVAHLWNRSVVTDQTVTQNIFELRKALRDGRGRQEAPEYIATVPKRGYQLVVDAELLRTAQTEGRSRMPFLLKVLLKLIRPACTSGCRTNQVSGEAF